MDAGPGLCPGGDVVGGQLGSLDFPFLQGPWWMALWEAWPPRGAWGLLAPSSQSPLRSLLGT